MEALSKTLLAFFLSILLLRKSLSRNHPSLFDRKLIQEGCPFLHNHHHPPFPFFGAKFNYLSLSLTLHHRIHPPTSTWVIKLHSSLIANIANGYIDLMAVKMSCLEYHQHLQLLLLQDCPLVVDYFQALLSFFFFSLPLSLLYNIISLECVF